ncbi:YeaC family protein, partial [Psychrobacter sp. H8-1]
MDKQTILASLTPEVVEKFRVAIELGKWPDGGRLTVEQRETCMQAVMVWEHEHLPPAERTGYIHKPV